eukprot:TRINITY_DN5482_c0_g2_i2.p1 TRINITY_DN5482_c0_g2~~TRINITY_DN5482_c0_g2_i2.p1  ORF type:complete len:261 (-),score=93.49 TRINITY_DN5482_c0_g2_i2:232-951(-)
MIDDESKNINIKKTLTRRNSSRASIYKKNIITAIGLKNVEGGGLMLQFGAGDVMEIIDQSNDLEWKVKLNDNYGLVNPETVSIVNEGGNNCLLKHMPTKQHWKLILQEGRVIQYEPDTLILRKGSNLQRIYQILSGTCRITVVDNTETEVVVSHLSAGDIFGEMSFIAGKGASANVIADGDVEVYLIEATHLEGLFQKNKYIAGCFYKYLSSILVKRISGIDVKIYEESEFDEDSYHSS